MYIYLYIERDLPDRQTEKGTDRHADRQKDRERQKHKDIIERRKQREETEKAILKKERDER